MRVDFGHEGHPCGIHLGFPPEHTAAMPVGVAVGRENRRRILDPARSLSLSDDIAENTGSDEFRVLTGSSSRPLGTNVNCTSVSRSRRDKAAPEEAAKRQGRLWGRARRLGRKPGYWKRSAAQLDQPPPSAAPLVVPDWRLPGAESPPAAETVTGYLRLPAARSPPAADSATECGQ